MFATLKNAGLYLFNRDRVLMSFAIFSFMGVAMMLVPMAFDTREVMGLNPWIKPLKFTASFGPFLCHLRLAAFLSSRPAPAGEHH